MHFHTLINGPPGGQQASQWMNNGTTIREWYDNPLTVEDALAGGVLLSVALLFIPLYAIAAQAMFQNDKDVVGFRFLFSAAVADILLLVNYGAWPGMTILFKSEIISTNMRHWVQMYLDWAWFSMCYHYSLIAWSRFAAIKYPHSFRSQPRRTSYLLCASCYVFSAVQVLLTHFQPWYVTFYYEPAAYGMLSEDFVKYLKEGQSLMFLSFHLLMIVIPIVFYTSAIFLLIQHKRTAKANGHRSFTSTSHHVESRLIIPCVFNSIVFIVGQVVITVGTGEGRWATWTVMLLFSFNSAVNPILYLFFSAVIRKRIFSFFGIDTDNGRKRPLPVYSTLLGNTVTPTVEETNKSTVEEGDTKSKGTVVASCSSRYLSPSNGAETRALL